MVITFRELLETVEELWDLAARAELIRDRQDPDYWSNQDMEIRITDPAEARLCEHLKFLRSLSIGRK